MEVAATKATFQKYPAYKDSGEYWMGDIPEHWGIKKLKHVFQEKKKVTNPSLNCGSISFGKVVYKDDEKVPLSTKASYQEVLAGEYLVNPLNLNYDLISLRIGLSDINVVVSSGYIVLKNAIELDKSYFNYLLHRYDVAYMKLLGSGVRQTISFNHIANSLLAYPPIEEQTAITTFLDDKTTKIDRAIAKKEQLIALLKERKQIIIQNAVTKGLDPTVKLKDSGVAWIGEIPEGWTCLSFRRISYLKQGLQISIDKRKEEPEVNALEYITTKSIHNPENPKHYVYNPPKAVICLYDDILLGRTGNTGEVVTDVHGVFHNNFFKIVYNKQLIIKKYLVHYLRTNGIQKHILLAAGVTTIPDLNHGDFLDLPVVLPKLNEQRSIIEYIETQSAKVNQAISLQQTQIEKLKEYKASLIDSAVTGKIKVS
jgi:type I restriction enzyme S subunit